MKREPDPISPRNAWQHCGHRRRALGAEQFACATVDRKPSKTPLLTILGHSPILDLEDAARPLHRLRSGDLDRDSQEGTKPTPRGQGDQALTPLLAVRLPVT